MSSLARLLPLLLAVAVIAGGCVTKIGDTDVVFRVGRGTPDRIVEDVDGEYEILEGAQPAGQSLFLIMRGIW
jgi:hypothetical protein